jgi:hypothetical protein
MTTIAYKWPYIAADSLAIGGYVRLAEDRRKIHVGHGSVNLREDENGNMLPSPVRIVVAGSGDSARIAHISRQIISQVARTGSYDMKTVEHIDGEGKAGDFSLITIHVVDEDLYAAVNLYWTDMNPEWMHKDTIIALGSGREFALGAMDAGASAIEAVRISSKRDIYTGGRIHAYNIEKNEWETHNVG